MKIIIVDFLPSSTKKLLEVDGIDEPSKIYRQFYNKFAILQTKIIDKLGLYFEKLKTKYMKISRSDTKYYLGKYEEAMACMTKYGCFTTSFTKKMWFQNK